VRPFDSNGPLVRSGGRPLAGTMIEGHS